MITIRKAKADDAPFIALIVCMALGEDESHRLYPVFRELAAQEIAQYSYQNTLIAEYEGNKAGAIIGYDGAKLHKLRQPIYPLIKQYTGENIEIEEETQAGEFYLDSVAVLPSYRGKGIGEKLLVTMRDEAFTNGFSHVGLLVDYDNPGAESLYSKLGFRRINPTTFLGHKMWHMQVTKE